MLLVERLVLIFLHCDDTHVSGIILTGEFSFKQCNSPFFFSNGNQPSRPESLHLHHCDCFLLSLLISFAFVVNYSVTEYGEDKHK